MRKFVFALAMIAVALPGCGHKTAVIVTNRSIFPFDKPSNVVFGCDVVLERVTAIAITPGKGKRDSRMTVSFDRDNEMLGSPISLGCSPDDGNPLVSQLIEDRNPVQVGGLEKVTMHVHQDDGCEEPPKGAVLIDWVCQVSIKYSDDMKEFDQCRYR